MMTDEEKKAIENLKFRLTTNGEISIYDGTTILVKLKDIEIVLNLLSKKDKEIDLILSEFAEIIRSCPADIYENDYKIDCENKECDEKECFKEYFYEKVEEENDS